MFLQSDYYNIYKLMEASLLLRDFINQNFKFVVLYLVVLFISVALFGKEGALLIPQSSLQEQKYALQERDEVAMMRQLITTTEQQLEMQRELLEWMLTFREQKQAFSSGNENKAHVRAMVQNARRLFESLAEKHLQHLFSREYLDELQFFSSIAGKNKIRGISR